MNKKNLFSVLLTVLVASAAIIGGAYAFKDYSFFGTSPENTLKEFYTEWVTYEGSPLADRIYQDSVYVSNTFATKLDQTIDSFDKGSYDPILCAQDIPVDIKLVNTSSKGDSAIVTVDEVFSGGNKMVEVAMSKKSGDWQIQDVICEEGERDGDLTGSVSPAIQNLVGDYIRDNIGELSPEEEVLGGKFYVTSIRFTGPYSCVVDYEDGHIALTAQASFEVPSAGEVKITEFKLQDTVGTPDFKRTGNLTNQGGAWTLVYEEAGKPALSVELVFDESSLCQDAYSDKSCSPVYWEAGDRSEVIGYHQGETVLVSSLRIVGEASQKVIGQ